MQTINHHVIDRLLNYLENGDEVDRCYAAKTLGNLKVKAATSALLERIKDEDIDVCIDAVTALGKIKDFSAIPSLLESLEKDPDSDVKLAITESLVYFQSQDAIDVLLKLAEDRPEGMDFDQNDDWDSWWDLQEKAIFILGEMKIQKAVPILKDILEDEFSQDIESIVLKALAKIGGDADEYLINRLNNSDNTYAEKHQRRTATALGFSQSKETLQALGRALVSKSADTRENVIYALGQRKASQYIRAILLSLRDPNANVKSAALEVVQQLASETQIDQELDFNQIAAFLHNNLQNKDLSDKDITLQTTVLSFFKEQEKIHPVIAKLSKENQSLIHQSLLSSNDNVLTQAAQLAGISRDPDNAEALFNLAFSESHSVWVKKEAILALGTIINNIEPEHRKQALLDLRQLVHHEEQAVRFAALQSLLTLSNEYQLPEPSDDDNELPPISILLATLKGEQFDIQAEDEICSTGETPTEDNCSSCPKNTACSDNIQLTESIIKQFEDNDIKESTHLIADNEDQTIGAAQSTLEAIAMDNVESTLSVIPETTEQKSHNKESGPFISEELPEELDEYVAIMRKNFSAGKKIVRRKINTFSDARHICARLLSDNIHSRYNELIVSTLSECLNDEDEQLRQEAAETLSLISLKNPLIPGLNNTFGKLVTLLDSKDSDMRIACIHAISHSGNPAALPHLLDYLSDEEYIVKLQAIEGLVYILNNTAGLTQEQKDEFMVLDEVNPTQIVAALFDCLEDKNYSVSMSAIEALVELKQTDAIEKFVDVALTGEGQSARQISKLLKKLDVEKSTEVLLARLDSVSDSSYRRYVMEMLEVVIDSDEGQKQAA
ncbi:MAG: HEAT repeat domain-containing protein [gamma proteobacterium symbiont of Taylorina sp.]|nr:HEAT repeat domain-containing protein [gamma proteobacterium symbiont of Taylorina sp.]